jgi:hypothetical protein
MNDSTFLFEFSELNLDVRHIEMVMGYREGESYEAISDIVAQALHDAEYLCELKAEYRIFSGIEFNHSEKSVRIAGLEFSLNKIVFGQLRKSESMAVFLSTAGEKLGEMSRKAMMDGDLLQGYIYDVIGSEAADGASALMQGKLKMAAEREGFGITNRYSPGYCDWNVDEQHKLFHLMKDNFCGITLNSSALMSPEKSVSGFIGIGRSVRFNKYTCGLCDMKDCIYRKIR